MQTCFAAGFKKMTALAQS